MAPSKSWTVADLEPQGGKTILITGGNSGVGYECALHLALRGATVIIGCRNAQRGAAAVAGIQAALDAAAGPAGGGNGGTITCEVVDVSDLSSVRAFAAAFRDRHAALHVLLNNAGVMMLPRSLTPDGQERQMATNHLGHFALTGLLLPLLTATPGARVVNVSSPAHRGASSSGLSLEDWTLERGYTPVGSYARSKLANLLFTRELARRAAAAAAAGGAPPLLAVTAQPGWARTALESKAQLPALMAVVAAPLKLLLSHSAEAGACPLLYAATEAGVAADDYWSPKWVDLKGPPAGGFKSAAAKDDAAAAALWAKSEEVTGVTYKW